MMPRGIEAQRSAGIDVLRGICVILVVLHHIHINFKMKKFDVVGLLPEPVGQVVFWSGYFAVIAFFVISGFLITSLSLRRWGSLPGIDAGGFYWMRIARIVPCLLLLVAVLSILHLLQAQGFVIPPNRATLGRSVLAAFTFHINWLEGHHGYLPGSWDILWSLSVEEVFYLLFPVLCLVFRRGPWLLVPLIALIVIAPFNRVALAGQDPWQEYAYLSCVDGIAFGCLAALLAARVRPTAAALRSLMVLGTFAVLFIVVCRQLVVAAGLERTGLGISVLEFGVALMLIAISKGVGNRFFESWMGWIRLVGRSSYEIYLGHMLVILGLMPFIISLNPQGSGIPGWYGLLLLLSVGLGWTVSTYYSEPLNRALRSRRPRAQRQTAIVS